MRVAKLVQWMFLSLCFAAIMQCQVDTEALRKMMEPRAVDTETSTRTHTKPKHKPVPLVNCRHSNCGRASPGAGKRQSGTGGLV